MTKAQELLDTIPESLWDVPRVDLQGETPRQAADHFTATGCRGCYFALVALSKERNR